MLDFPGFITPLHKVKSPLLQEKEITLFVKRDDLIHPEMQGNKGRKLKYSLEEAKKKKYKTLLTFGGNRSNHIPSTAAACTFEFQTIGVIRGEEPPELSESLLRAVDLGMKLHFVSRSDYDKKEQPEFIEHLHQLFGDFYLIPQGGTSVNALRGVEEVIGEIDESFDVLCVPVGTGGTLAGLVAGLKGEKQVIGFSSLKGADTLTAKVNELVNLYCGTTYSNFSINFDYHLGGYAKTTPELLDFIKQMEKNFRLFFEPVYTGKMMYGIFDMIQKDAFKPGTVIIALHTGGVLGWTRYPKKI